MKTDIPPLLLGKTQDDAVLWDNLTDRFNHLCDFVENMRLETVEEAIGEKLAGQWHNTAPHWEDQEIGNTFRAWNLIPYVDALDQTEIKVRMDTAKYLIPFLKTYFEERILTVEFLKLWGSFCSAAGTIEFLYSSKTSIGHARSAYAGGKARTDIAEAHRRWFSHYFLKVYSRGKRKYAEQMVENLINAILDEKIPQPIGFDVKWFEQYLNFENIDSVEYRRLVPAFNEDNLSVECMKKLVKKSTSDIPPTNLVFPGP